jgi:predicted PurR-regulated permease PerM
MKTAGSPTTTIIHPQGRRVISMLDIWKIVGIVLIGLLATWFVAHIIDVLLVMFAAIVLAEAIRPLVYACMARARLRRWAAIIAVYAALLALAGTLVYVVVSPLIVQVQTLSQNFPELVNAIQARLAALHQTPAGSAIMNTLGSQTQAVGNAVLNTALTIPSTAFSVLFNAAFALFLSFYWLNSTDGLRPFVASLFPERFHKLLNQMCDEAGLQLGAYVRSVVINMAVIGTITSGVLWALGIPYPLVLGVFAALTEAIPLVGPYIGGTPAVLLALSISPFRALLVLIAYVVVQQFESNILVPWVIGRTLKINPLLTLLSVLIGASLYGIAGALLAVPVLVIVQIIFLDLAVPMLRGELKLRETEHHLNGTRS